MSASRGVRVYKGMLRLYPQAHRDEYGEAMLQLFGDRWRDERPASSLLQRVAFWGRIVGDVVKTALTERTEKPMVAFKENWWLWLAMIGGALEVAAVAAGLLDPTASAAERLIGIVGGGGFALATLYGVRLVRQGKQRRGGYLVAMGMIPVAAAGIVFFWFPPLYLATIGGIAVMVKAFGAARRGATPQPA